MLPVLSLPAAQCKQRTPRGIASLLNVTLCVSFSFVFSSLLSTVLQLLHLFYAQAFADFLTFQKNNSWVHCALIPSIFVLLIQCSKAFQAFENSVTPCSAFNIIMIS